MNWRKWNNIIHRDIGYLCFGLTIIYAVSGVAVNHIHSWNPTYKVERTSSFIDPLGEYDSDVPAELVQTVLVRLGETGALKSIFQPDPSTLQIFVEGNNIHINLKTGEVIQEKIQKRPLLYQFNFVHLNHPKKLWTWFADLYSISLALLAITGLFTLKGRKGITGRGAWLTGAGIIIPIIFLMLY